MGNICRDAGVWIDPKQIRLRIGRCANEGTVCEAVVAKCYYHDLKMKVSIRSDLPEYCLLSLRIETKLPYEGRRYWVVWYLVGRKLH